MKRSGYFTILAMFVVVLLAVIAVGCKDESDTPAVPSEAPKSLEMPKVPEMPSEQDVKDAAEEVEKTVDALKEDAKLPELPKLNLPEQTICPIDLKPIDKKCAAEYKDLKVYFCCDACKEAFLKAPEKFVEKLPQFKK